MPQSDLRALLARSRDRRLACGELGEDVQALSGLLASTAGRSRDLGIHPPPALPAIITALGAWSIELRRHGALPADPAARDPHHGLFDPQDGQEPAPSPVPSPVRLVAPRPRRKPRRAMGVVAVLVAVAILAVALTVAARQADQPVSGAGLGRAAVGTGVGEAIREARGVNLPVEPGISEARTARVALAHLLQALLEPPDRPGAGEEYQREG